MSNFSLDPRIVPVPQHSHPINKDELNSLVEIDGFIEDIRSGLLVPAPPTPSVIVNDGASTVGASTLWAHADHTHGFTTSTPANLTLTATSAEGSDSGKVRADHVHATSVLPWGKITPEYSRTTNGASINLNDAAFKVTEMVIGAITVDVARSYEVAVYGQVQLDEAAQIALSFFVDGTETARVSYKSMAALTPSSIEGTIRWDPTSGTKAIGVRVARTAGTGSSGTDFIWQAATTAPLQMWVKDIGPR